MKIVIIIVTLVIEKTMMIGTLVMKGGTAATHLETLVWAF